MFIPRYHFRDPDREGGGGGNDQLDDVSSDQLRWMRQPFMVGTDVHLLVGTDKRLFRLAF